MNEVDRYLAEVSPEQREQLERLRSIVKRIVPDASEGISYGVPTFRLNGMLCSFAAFRNHCSFFPGKAPIVACANELKNWKTSAGTVRFTLTDPLPDELIERMVKLCVARNESKGKR